MALYGRIKKFREPILHPESGVRYEWIPDKWISKRDKKDTPLRELEINFHAVKKHIAFIVVSFTSSSFYSQQPLRQLPAVEEQEGEELLLLGYFLIKRNEILNFIISLRRHKLFYLVTDLSVVSDVSRGYKWPY